MSERVRRSQDEWLDWYASHGGTKDLELDRDEEVCFHPEHGFIAWFKHDDILELHHMVGDGKYWARVLKDIMTFYGLKKLRAFTRRNPKAWSRKYGGHIRGYYMESDIDEIKV